MATRYGHVNGRGVQVAWPDYPLPGAQEAAAVPEPIGGDVVDIQARAAIVAVIAVLLAIGALR